MMKNNYNGWTNKQTWNVNLTYGEMFVDMCENSAPFDDFYHLADAFENTVVTCEEANLEDVNPSSIVYQAFEAYLAEVNWTEIVEHYIQDFPECIIHKEEEEEAE